jgi:hypothetical protein
LAPPAREHRLFRCRDCSDEGEIAQRMERNDVRQSVEVAAAPFFASIPNG